MNAPKMKTPGRSSGAGVGKSSEVGNLSADSTALGATAFCQCLINSSGCLVCRRWSRIIRGIEARRADSLRRQALGRQVFGGA